jgi:hypothetical protein
MEMVKEVLALERQVGFEGKNQHAAVQHRMGANGLDVLVQQLVRVTYFSSDQRFQAEHL